MSKYRNALPQLGGDLFLTESGLETTLVFKDGIDLPCFSAITMLQNEERRENLRQYYARHLQITHGTGAGFILDTTTWRSSPDWAEPLGYTLDELEQENRNAVALLTELRDRYETTDLPLVINCAIGPRGDGYIAGEIATVEEYESYHAWQIGIFTSTEADMVTATTFTNIPESIGFVHAAAAHHMPVVVSFTVETDGRLPTGETLAEAILAVDRATNNTVAYYMVNCAHPTHFDGALEDGADWMDRVRGVRANASSCSHAELDEATELDDGDPVELGDQYAALRVRFPGITVLGGCCGTDHRHVEAIANACLKAA